MINWFDMPAEGLSNGGLFEIKELTATENKVYQKDGEVYNKVTVNVPSPTGKITITENGTDINIAQYALADVNVEGGGGSSDFSTAEVTLNLTLSDNSTIVREVLKNVYLDYPDEDFGYMASSLLAENHKVSLIIYNGHAIFEGINAVNSNDERYPIIVDTPTTTGGVTYDDGEGIFIVTGDGTITATLSAE